MKTINRHGDTAIQWILDHLQDFGLSRQDFINIAGATSEHDIEVWLSGEKLFPESAMKRLGLFLGIHRGLVEITPTGHEWLAFEWFQRKTTIFPDFDGLSIRDYLLQHPTEDALNTVFRSVRALTS